jgi:hypothetical protein
MQIIFTARVTTLFLEQNENEFPSVDMPVCDMSSDIFF